MKVIKFKIATPERVLLQEDILQVSVPTESGEITILPDHIPLVSILKPGVLDVKRADNTVEVIAVSGGFIEITSNQVVILADTAETAKELDEERIEAARKQAEEKKLDKDLDDTQFAEVSAMIEKELARARAVKRWRNLPNIK